MAITSAATRRCSRAFLSGVRSRARDDPGRTHALAEGDEITVPGLGLALGCWTSRATRPDTSGTSEATRTAAVAFVGDTLFAGGCGRLFEGTPAQMADSLGSLPRFRRSTRVYCAHEYTLANLRFALAVEPGNAALQARLRRDQDKRDRGLPTVPSTIAEERATNPFLRAGEPDVFAAAQARAGRPLADAVDAFAVIREWKNGFR